MREEGLHSEMETKDKGKLEGSTDRERQKEKHTGTQSLRGSAIRCERTKPTQGENG